MLNLDGLDTDAERSVISVTEDLDLHGHLHAITFSERLNQAIRPTNGHLDGARVISQREREGSTFPAQCLLTWPCEVDDALKRDDLKIQRFRRRAQATN